EDQARQVEEQNRKLRDEIRVIREKLAGQPASAQTPAQTAGEEKTEGSSNATTEQASLTKPAPRVDGSTDVSNTTIAQEQKPDEDKKWEKYAPNHGFKLVNTEHGDLSLSIYTYTRYLNQRLLDDTYTNAFGTTTTPQRRQDFQIQKLQF